MKKFKLSICCLLVLVISGCGIFKPVESASVQPPEIKADQVLDYLEQQIEAKTAKKQSVSTSTSGLVISENTSTKPVTQSTVKVEEKVVEPVKTEVVKTEITPSPLVESDDIITDTKYEITKLLLDYDGTILLIAYSLLALLGAWYVKQTGKSSETIAKMQAAIDDNPKFNFKRKLIFRIIRWFYRKKVVKK